MAAYLKALCKGGLLAGLAFVLFGFAGQNKLREAIAQALLQARERGYLVEAGQQEPLLPQLLHFYRERNYEPLWLEDELADFYLTELEKAGEEGLEPDEYYLGRLQAYQQTRRPSVSKQAEQELLLTASFLKYIAHLYYGKVDPLTIDPSWHIRRDTTRIEMNLLRQAAEDKLADALAYARPDCFDYQLLKRALAKYRQFERSGGWQPLRLEKTLQLGDSDASVADVRRRLMQEGIHSEDRPPQPWLFDSLLDRSVRKFQRLHGLEADGRIGRRSLEKLNQPLEEKLAQIRINMERLRWLPRHRPDCEQYIRVNIAAFELDFISEGRRKINMDIIVGQPYRRTPVFEQELRYLVLNPYWVVPPVIIREDLIPGLRKDPAYLKKRGIKAYQGKKEVDPGQVNWQEVNPSGSPYWFRADPGPLNPLGKIKFMLPNRFSIYLHDTPSRELFDRRERMFSSGCIRLRDPFALAEEVLKPQGIDRDSLEQRLKSARSDTIYLKQPLSIQILYMSSWMDSRGDVHFSGDPYQRDPGLMRLFLARTEEEE